MMRRVAAVLLSLVLPVAARAQAPIAVPADTLHWELAGNATVVQRDGRACLRLDGAEATVKDLEFRDGVIDLDVMTPAARGFFGIEFRVSEKDESAEWVYFRPHKSGAPDALQYTPILHSGLNWQLYNGPGFTAAADIPRDRWFHIRLEVTGAQARFFIDDLEKPVLVMDDLKSGIQKGAIALGNLIGETYCANLTVRPTPDAPWQRRLPPMPPGTLTHWQISPSWDALARDLERPLTRAEADTTRWQAVEAEPPGLVAINRYRQSPHPRVSFAGDFSKRLEPQPGMRVVYARTFIESDRDEVRKLLLGYSDEASLFLNGRILWRGRSAQNFRDPAFLGIVNCGDDAVYLPLHKGRNELMLAVSELGGGWGWICRLEGAVR